MGTRLGFCLPKEAEVLIFQVKFPDFLMFTIQF
jgi:hypothetical protein